MTNPALAWFLQALLLVAALAASYRPLGDYLARVLAGTLWDSVA
ncbi:hypothetical protein [Streptacidiphilus neutrinimicus]|nr:hypothetical protein [Streptacidiphilus neutrinimicus]